MAKKTLYIDMDGVLVSFESGLARIPEHVRAAHAGREDEIEGIYGLMDPMAGALEAFDELAGLFEAYVLSTAPWKNPSAWSDKLLWVQRHLGGKAHKRLILTHNKHLARGDFLVDDRTKNGAGEFEGELVRFGVHPWPDWPAVVAYLKPRA